MRYFLKLVSMGIVMVMSPLSHGHTNNCQEAEKIIQLYQLEPLTFEGGYFKQTYKLTDKESGSPTATAILYLLKAHDKSRLHKLPHDEIWHFYSGDPVQMLQLLPDGSTRKIVLGNNVLAGQQTQVIVPKNTWQGAFVIEGGCFALLGTTMTPGFEVNGFQAGERDILIKRYPEQKDLIARLS